MAFLVFICFFWLGFMWWCAIDKIKETIENKQEAKEKKRLERQRRYNK